MDTNRKKEFRKEKPDEVIDISALEKTMKTAQRMAQSPDMDLSRMGKAIARATERRLLKQKAKCLRLAEQKKRKAQIRGSGTEKIYSFSQGSAPKDD